MLKEVVPYYERSINIKFKSSVKNVFFSLELLAAITHVILQLFCFLGFIILFHFYNVNVNKCFVTLKHVRNLYGALKI